MKNTKIYLITDYKMDFNELLDKVETALKEGIDYLQYRNKGVSTKQLLNEAKILKDLCKRYNTKFIINDRIDLALAVDADGVHLGADDMPISIARSTLPASKIIGATAKTVEQADTAKKEGADYLGVGAIYPSTTKPEAIPVSIETLKNIKKETGIDIFGIGGLTPENITTELLNSIDGVALVSAILNSNDIKRTINKIRSVLK